MPARNDIDRHLASASEADLLPIYALVGSDPFLLSEAVATLRAKVLTTAADFNRDELRAGQGPIARVLDAARTLPMMARRRWVLLADVHRLSAKDQESLLHYVDNPADTTVLCLCGEKIDQRKKLGQRLSKGKSLFSLEPPKQQALPGWIRARARRKDFEIAPDAAALLADLIGVELGALDVGLDKLALFAGQGQPITSDHVETLVAPTRVKSIFELTDAIGRRDLPRASLLLRNALSASGSGLPVLAMIARQIRHIVQVKALKAAGQSAQQIAKTVGVQPFLVEPLTAQARRYSEQELWRALDAVGRADISLKSSRLADGIVLDRLLVEMMG